MLNIIQSIGIVLATSVMTLLLLRFYLSRTIPILLEDVSESIGESFTKALKSIIKDPMAKRAMTILGNKSGEVRHNAAAENALAEGFLNNVAPEIRIILDRIDPDLIENYGAETIMNLAAKYMPTIQKFLPGGLEGLGFLQNKNSGLKSRF